MAEADIDLSEWLNPSLFKTSALLRILLVLLITICLLWLGVWVWLALSFFAGLLLLFMSAWLLALLLTPLVRYLVRFGLPKAAAIGASYVLLILVLGLFIALVVPGLISQTRTLIQNFGSLTSDSQRWLNETAQNFGLGTLNLNDLGKQFQGFATDLLKNALDIATGLAGFLVQTLLVLIISGSLLAGQRYSDKEKETPRVNSSIGQTVPPRWRKFGKRVRMSLERNFGVFLGGQLIVGILYGVVVAFVMSLVSLPYAVTTACVCGALMLIPLFGGPLSLFAPLLVAVSESPGIALIVLPVLFVVQTVLLNVVLPKIVGQSSGLGPVATLFVLLAGAQVGGVWGVLLGVPIAGVVMNILEYLITNSSWGETSEVKVGLSVTAGADTDPAAQAEVTVREVEKLEKEEQVTRS